MAALDIEAIKKQIDETLNAIKDLPHHDSDTLRFLKEASEGLATAYDCLADYSAYICPECGSAIEFKSLGGDAVVKGVEVWQETSWRQCSNCDWMSDD